MGTDTVLSTQDTKTSLSLLSGRLCSNSGRQNTKDSLGEKKREKEQEKESILSKSKAADGKVY